MGPFTKKKRHLSRAKRIKSAADRRDLHRRRCPADSETRALSVTFILQLANVVPRCGDVDVCCTSFDADTPVEHHRADGHYEVEYPNAQLN